MARPWRHRQGFGSHHKVRSVQLVVEIEDPSVASRGSQDNGGLPFVEDRGLSFGEGEVGGRHEGAEGFEEDLGFGFFYSVQLSTYDFEILAAKFDSPSINLTPLHPSFLCLGGQHLSHLI